MPLSLVTTIAAKAAATLDLVKLFSVSHCAQLKQQRERLSLVTTIAAKAAATLNLVKRFSVSHCAQLKQQRVTLCASLIGDRKRS